MWLWTWNWCYYFSFTDLNLSESLLPAAQRGEGLVWQRVKARQYLESGVRRGGGWVGGAGGGGWRGWRAVKRQSAELIEMQGTCWLQLHLSHPRFPLWRAQPSQHIEHTHTNSVHIKSTACSHTRCKNTHPVVAYAWFTPQQPPLLRWRSAELRS